MCGRAYHTVSEEELAMRYLNKKRIKIPSFKPNYNLSPSQSSPVVFVRDDERQIDLFRWGLIPSWAKDEKIGYKMINARSETVTEKPSFRSAFKQRRCILPLSGFYEWQRQGEEKRPFSIFKRDGAPLSVAGIWETWTPKEHTESAEPVYSFSLLTTQANSFMSKIHDRMPVLLSEEQEREWLNSDPLSAQQIHRLLKPCPEDWLDCYEVSTAVNSPKNNREELLIPIGKLKA